MEQLLNFETDKFDVNLLDQVVETFYKGSNPQQVSFSSFCVFLCVLVCSFGALLTAFPGLFCDLHPTLAHCIFPISRSHCLTTSQRQMAQKLLTQLQEHPKAWTRVDTILKYSKSQNTKVSLPLSA